MNPLNKLAQQPKVQLLLLLALLTGIGVAGSEGWGVRLGQAGFAVLSAVLAEWAFFGVVRPASLHSAGISGLLVGILLAPGADLLVVWFAAVSSIASKKLVRFDEQTHIFNPAAFGLVLTTALFGNQMTWWGSSSLIVIILGTGLILFRLHRLSLSFSYFITRVLGAILIGGSPVSFATVLLPNLFFALIMLVEPKTSPPKRFGQWIFGALAGVISSVSFRFVPSVDGDLTGLLAANLFYSVLRTIKPREISA